MCRECSNGPILELNDKLSIVYYQKHLHQGLEFYETAYTLTVFWNLAYCVKTQHTKVKSDNTFLLTQMQSN